MMPRKSKFLHLVLISIFSLGISGCSLLGEKKITPTIKTVPVEKTPLGLKPPRPIQLQKLEWIVITPENAESVWNQLRNQDTNTVLFALTDSGYQQISLDFAEIRIFISNQRFIIEQYQEYYEPQTKKNQSKTEKP